MSYYTRLSGSFAITPPLDPEQTAALAAALGDASSWRVPGDGARLLPTDVPTRTYYWEELQGAVDAHLKPERRRLVGVIRWEGEQEGDGGTLSVVRGRVTTTPDAPEALSPEAARDILARVESGESVRMREGFEMLWALPRPLPGVARALRPRLTHPDPAVRHLAAEGLADKTLTGAAASSPATVAALITRLADPHEWVRSSAAASLGKLGRAALPAVPALERLRGDPSYGPRGRAEEALARLRDCPRED